MNLREKGMILSLACSELTTFWSGKIGVCCYSGLAERSAEYYVNSIFYRS